MGNDLGLAKMKGNEGSAGSSQGTPTASGVAKRKRRYVKL